MKVLWKSLVILLVQRIFSVDCEEFVTVLIPKATQNELPYEIFYVSSKLSQKSKVGVQFRQHNITNTLKSGSYMRVQFANDDEIIQSPVDVAVTLLRDVTDKNSFPLCTTQKVKVTGVKKQTLTFIQLDKPIYKPGDLLRARVVTLDRNLNPWQANSIEIIIFAPSNYVAYNRTIQDSDLGVGEIEFNIPERAILGEWRIRVVIDRYDQFVEEKVFNVQKYVKPLFELVFMTSDYAVHRNSTFTLSFYGKYPFDEMVRGNAELKLDILDKSVRWNFPNVSEVQTFPIALRNLQTENSQPLLPAKFDRVLCKATLTFIEPESKTMVNKTITIAVAGNTKYNLKVSHNSHFVSGLPFVVEVRIFDFLNRKITSHLNEIDFEYRIKPKSEAHAMRFVKKVLEDSIMYIISPENSWSSFDIVLKFIDSEEYTATVMKQQPNGLTTKDLSILFTPENPKIGERLTISVDGNERMNRIFIFLMNAQGTVISEAIDCDYEKPCKFQLEMHEKYAPEATLNVYYIEDKNVIYFGRANISSESFGSNTLTMEVSKNPVMPSETVRLKFETQLDSTIYIQAIDKRLKYFPESASDLQHDIRHGFQQYNRDHHILTFDMNEHSTWHKCDKEEIERVKSGRKLSARRSDSLSFPLKHATHKQSVAEHERGNVKVERDQYEEFLRDNFPDTWIFDTIKMDKFKCTASRDYITPDSITDWHISAFSTVDEHRVAIAPAQELSVKQSFFIRLNTPYAIRYREILRLDVLVYNYAETRDDLTVDVAAHNGRPVYPHEQEFEFIEINSESDFCDPIPSYNISFKKQVTVPYMSIKRVSFYVRSFLKESLSPKRNIKLKVTAKAVDGANSTYIDGVTKSISLEPAGVSKLRVKAADFHMSKDKPHANYSFAADDSDGVDFSSYAIISGASMTLKVDIKFGLYDWYTFDQKTARLKGAVEIYRYQLAQGLKANKTELVKYCATLIEYGLNAAWSFDPSTGFLANILDSLISILEVDIVKGEGNMESSIHKMVVEGFQVLRQYQNPNGTFSQSSFPGSAENETGIMFDTAYALIPILKYKRYDSSKFLPSMDEVVKKGIERLKIFVSERNSTKLMNDALSITAYVFALNEDYDASGDVIDVIDEATFKDDEEKTVCYRLSLSYHECDFRHTAYAALALITLKRYKSAEYAIRWIVPKHEEAEFNSRSYDYALSSEVIARMADFLKEDYANLTVEVSNESDFNTTIHIDNSNKFRESEIEMPKFTKEVKLDIKGEGYCHAKIIFKTKAFINLQSTEFSVKAVPTTRENETDVLICMEYFSMENSSTIINEVEIPTGYVYVRHENYCNEMKYLQKVAGESTIILHYDDLRKNEKYCTRIFLRKVFHVYNIQSSAVKAVNMDQPNDIAVAYYSFDRHC